MRVGAVFVIFALVVTVCRGHDDVRHDDVSDEARWFLYGTCGCVDHMSTGQSVATCKVDALRPDPNKYSYLGYNNCVNGYVPVCGKVFTICYCLCKLAPTNTATPAPSTSLSAIVPDVVSMAPPPSLSVSYGSTVVNAGDTLAVSSASSIPSITFPTQTGQLYTIAMVDPEGIPKTSPGDQFFHWLVVNVRVQWSGIQTNIWGDGQCKNVGFFDNFGLEDCQKKCLETATCTAINYNGVSNVCVLRGCTQPVQPPQWQLGDYRGYYIMDPIGSGQTLTVYREPTPPRLSGRHRYVFLAYQQQATISSSLVGSQNCLGGCFHTIAEFANDNNLGDPIAGNFFFADAEVK